LDSSSSPDVVIMCDTEAKQDRTGEWPIHKIKFSHNAKCLSRKGRSRDTVYHNEVLQGLRSAHNLLFHVDRRLCFFQFSFWPPIKDHDFFASD